VISGPNRARLLAVALALVVGASCSDAADVASEPAADPAVVEEGAAVYGASCAECHGENLPGSDEGPSLLSEVYEPNHHADVAIALAVQRGSPAHHWGFGPMQPVEGLDEADIDAVIAFIRETQATEGFEPYPP